MSMRRIHINYDFYIKTFGKADIYSTDVTDEIIKHFKRDILFRYGKQIKQEVLDRIMDRNISHHPYYKENFDEYYEKNVDIEAWSIAVMHLQKIIDRIWKSKLEKWDLYISSPEGREAMKKRKEEEKTRSKFSWIYKINKNGLDVTINTNTHHTSYQYKNGTPYEINGTVNFDLKDSANSSLINKVILECAEAGLHNKWIAKILWIDLRKIKHIASKIGANITTTPRSMINKIPVIRVLDTDDMFIVEKQSPYYNTPNA